MGLWVSVIITRAMDQRQTHKGPDISSPAFPIGEFFTFALRD
ncbi:MAG: hypothetical protein OSB15_06910 [Amylibacter sp.]|nr:hypothetical protein [Amylibacter sp.]